jgi:hypothetical protein
MGICIGVVGLGAGVPSEGGAASSVFAGFCAGGSGCPHGGGSCAMTEIGQINKEKAIFHIIFMTNHGDGQ